MCCRRLPTLASSCRLLPSLASSCQFLPAIAAPCRLLPVLPNFILRNRFAYKELAILHPPDGAFLIKTGIWHLPVRARTGGRRHLALGIRHQTLGIRYFSFACCLLPLFFGCQIAFPATSHQPLAISVLLVNPQFAIRNWPARSAGAPPSTE